MLPLIPGFVTILLQQGTLVNFTTKTYTFYLAEGFIALIFFIVLYHFATIYEKRFIRLWSFSWLYFFLSMISLTVLSLYGLDQHTPVRLIGSYFSIVFHVLQVFFLLAGCYERVKEKTLSLFTIYRWSVGILLIGLLVVLPFRNDDSYEQRHLLRVGFRYATLILGFISAAYVTAWSVRFRGGAGKMMITLSFFLFGAYHIYYLMIVILNHYSLAYSFPMFFGIAELLIACITGLSMVIWLLEDQRAMLLKSNKELDNFYYRTSHDLRAPISSMQGIANLAKLESKDEHTLNFIFLMEQRIAKLDRVIYDILDVAETKQKQSQPQMVKLKELITDIVAAAHFKVNDKVISLRYTEHSSHVLTTDSVLLKKVMGNIINNALKFHNHNAADPFVKIDFTRKRNQVMITITDNGIGIHEKGLPKIFDMFYREHSEIEGTGLGLYVAKETVAKINGTLSVKSKSGTGSVFTIHLWKA